MREVAAAGRMRERLRFRGPLSQEVGPRERALGQVVAALRPEEAVALGAEAGFVELSAHLMMSTPWEVAASRRWTKKAGILSLEGSALVWAARHRLRSARAGPPVDHWM